MENSFNQFIYDSIQKNWDLPALTDYKGITLQYKDVARKIEKLHIMFEEGGVAKGDKIALCGRNSAHWGVAFLAVLTYGAVAVPILHEFKADNVHNIVNHSDAKLLFVGDMVWENLDEAEMPNLEGIILINDYSLLVSRSERLTYAREHLNEMFGKRYPRQFLREMINYHSDTPDELAMINYTSGTTSYSKGVMLPYRSLWSNTLFAYEVLSLSPGDRVVSMLPMAHMYGMAFEFIYEFCCGCNIFFLTRMPSPKIIFQAFNEVKPRIIIAVPLIIEKIIKKNVMPKLQTTTMKFLMKLPLVNDKIRDNVRQQVIDALGGNFKEVIIGGALYRGQPGFMVVLFALSVLAAGAAWCSHLCYFGSWDQLAASRTRPRPHPHPFRLRALSLLVTCVCALLLRAGGAPSAPAVAGGLLLGILLVPAALLFSRRRGYAVYCTMLCPLGMLACLLGSGLIKGKK